jgi:hypothetical protein
MYDEGTCRIARHANGWEGTMRDPAIDKANRARDKMRFEDPKRPPYRDPNVTMVFTKEEDVLAFLKKNLDKMSVEADFDTSFDMEVASDNDEDD